MRHARPSDVLARASHAGTCSMPSTCSHAAGMLEDALREYSELEACYLEALAQGGPLAAHPFGARPLPAPHCSARCGLWKQGLGPKCHLP